MTTRYLSFAAALSAACLAGPAMAGEIYGGVYVHEVDTPFTLKTYEGGTDIQIGIRADEIEALAPIGKPAPYIFASANTAGDTSFVAAGLAWKAEIGPVYLRPGIGLALHDAPETRISPDGLRRTDLGSRVLFEPELAIGVDLGERVSVEASWVHISNAQLFDSEQNPGIDMMGLRANYRF